MQGVTINVTIGGDKGLLGKSLSEIKARPVIVKKKKKTRRRTQAC